MQTTVILSFIIGNTILALMVLYNNPKSWTNLLFTLLVGILTAYLTINSLLYSFQDIAISLLLSRFIIALGAIINLLVFLFLTTFPQKIISLQKRVLFLLLAITASLFVAGFTPLIFKGVTIENSAVVPTPGLLMPIFLIHTLVLIFGGIISIFLRFRKSTGIEKTRIRFVFIGFLTLFSLIITLNFIATVFFKFGNFVPLLPIYILIFNIIISYAIIRHRLIEVRTLVARTVAFSLLTLIIAGIYAAGLFSIPLTLPQALQTPTQIILALFLAFTFKPLQQLLEKITENIFHQKGYSTDEALNQLGDITRSTLSLDKLCEKVILTISKTLQINKGAFILITTKDDKKTITTINEGFNPTPKISADDIRQLIKHANNNIIIFEETEESKLKKIMRKQGVSLIIPLITNTATHGILVLGERQSGNIYNTQDINLLNLFTPQISIAIQNALAYHKINRFNITLKKKVTEATADLRKANKNLKHLDKLKDEFVFIATHELKTPVTVMKGYLSMINDGTYGKIPTQMKPPLEEIKTANVQLIQLVTDLLEIARAEAKTIRIDTKPTEIFPIIRDVSKNLSALAKDKNLKIDYKTLPNNHVEVFADSDRIKEISNNLITNAIKYSDQGTITITHESDGKDLTTHIADQGAGMSKTDQKKIFQRFFRAESTAQQPGTGLGLFIVKQIVEKMNGKIWFESELGKGTTFSFALPLTKPAKKKK